MTLQQRIEKAFEVYTILSRMNNDHDLNEATLAYNALECFNVTSEDGLHVYVDIFIDFNYSTNDEFINELNLELIENHAIPFQYERMIEINNNVIDELIERGLL